jgi:hypothetical protein
LQVVQKQAVEYIYPTDCSLLTLALDNISNTEFYRDNCELKELLEGKEEQFEP